MPVAAVGLQSVREAQVWRGNTSLRPAVSYEASILAGPDDLLGMHMQLA